MTIENARHIGPFSKPHRLRKLDGRSREARYLHRIESELLDQLGGAARVSVAKRILCERVAVDLMRLELLDGKMAAGVLSDHDGRVAHALRNSLRLALKDIGLEGAAVRPGAALEAHRAAILAQRAAGDAA